MLPLLPGLSRNVRFCIAKRAREPLTSHRFVLSAVSASVCSSRAVRFSPVLSLTEARDFLSSSSHACIGALLRNATTARQASAMSEKYSIADATNGFSSAVIIVTSLMNASVPSLPTIQCAIISNGSSYSTNGSILIPVTFLILYLCLISARSFG